MWDGVIPWEWDKYVEERNKALQQGRQPPPAPCSSQRATSTVYSPAPIDNAPRYKTVFDRYFDNMRPWQVEKLLTPQTARELPYGAHINLMYGGVTGPVEFEIIDYGGIKQLRDVITGDKEDANTIFNKLGNNSACHTAWRI